MLDFQLILLFALNLIYAILLSSLSIRLFRKEESLQYATPLNDLFTFLFIYEYEIPILPSIGLYD